MNPITFNFAYFAPTGGNPTPTQTVTINLTGTYEIDGFGAQGGAGRNLSTGGLGAETGGYFNLNAGDQIEVLIGGQGAVGTNDGGGGGGGGTFVFRSTDGGQNYSLLLAAGGGGGGGNGAGVGGASGIAAVPNSNGDGSGGTAGLRNNGVINSGGGGAGINGAGGTGNAPENGGGAPSIRSSGTGTVGGGNGGYGGGGGGTNNTGGGGGGYTGGNGGINGSGGLGGRSFNAGTPIAGETRSGVGTGDGSARVQFFAAPAPTPAPSPAPCYVTGTRIRILRGLAIQDVPVERLRVGDIAITASGKPRPIRWIGTRAYPGLSAPKHDRPVRIRAGAVGEGMPARDLLVSPDHCLWLDGLFVAAGHLSNGTSIIRGEAVRDLTYWHVELDSHDLLLAENTPAESFLAAPGVRAGFDGTALPEAAVAPVSYRVRAERHTPEMDALRERLILRAGLSIEPVRYGAVRAWLDVCDGARVAGWAQDDAHPDAPVCLDILVDGAVVAMALAQDHRADLAAAGMGDGRHGFDITLDEPLMRGVAHTVEVRRSTDGLRVGAMAVDEAGAWTALLAA